MKTNRRTAGHPFGGGAIVRAVEENGQAFKSAPRISKTKQCEFVQESVHRLLACRFEHNAEQAAGSREIPLPNIVTGVAFEGRVQDAQYFRPLLQPSRDAQARLVVARKPYAERAQAAQREVHVIRTDA